jgi:iron complex transport system substrate-binding protein
VPLRGQIGWVSELIEIAGGRDCFSGRSQEPAAKGRVIADPNEVVRRAPDIIMTPGAANAFGPSR